MDRLIGIYLRDVLVETKEPLTTIEIRKELEDDYGVDINLTTVRRYLHEMESGMVGYKLGKTKKDGEDKFWLEKINIRRRTPETDRKRKSSIKARNCVDDDCEDLKEWLK